MHKKQKQKENAQSTLDQLIKSKGYQCIVYMDGGCTICPIHDFCD